jgi:hypothetical protein
VDHLRAATGIGPELVNIELVNIENVESRGGR